MSRRPGALVAGACAVCVLALGQHAAAAVSLSTEVSPRKVEVGDRFVIRLRAMGDSGERLQNPALKLPAGVSASGPSVSSQSQVSIVNGQMTQSIGISATWVLSASKPGTYRIGPASVQTDKGTSSDRPVTVVVVPQGSLPPPPLAGQGLDPFNMLPGFGQGFPGMPGFPGFPGFDDDDQQAEPQLPELPEEYRVQHAPDPIAFARTRAVPRKVVVGEQVTLSGYAYGGRGAFRLGQVGEPSRDDFLAFNLMDDGSPPTGYQFDLDGQRWIVAKVSEFALFPLKAGKLQAGELSVGFGGRGYSNSPQGLIRKSQPIEIDVVEPPLSGRPPGYRIGDVGHYTLSAQVSPREVPLGGSISVVAKLEGVGNLPSTLLLPERRGVHFLEPQLVDQVGPKHGVVQGFRTFTYVVELSQPGEQDLGEITLPYYDAKARAYGVARAALGKVKVTGSAPAPSASPAPGADAQSPSVHLKDLIKPPPHLDSAGSHAASYWPSRAGYWLLLLGLPLTTVLGFALSDLTRFLRRRLSERRASLSAAQGGALEQLSKSATAADVGGSASAAERALVVAIERATGIKARGVLKSELAVKLEQAGLPGEQAEHCASLLWRCDELRFAGEGTDLTSFATEVRDACKKLALSKPRKPQGDAS